MSENSPEIHPNIVYDPEAVSRARFRDLSIHARNLEVGIKIAEVGGDTSSRDVFYARQQEIIELCTVDFPGKKIYLNINKNKR